MKKLTSALLISLLLFCGLTGSAFAADTVQIYRLYNSRNHEHLYTSDKNEANTLASQADWNNEGTGWNSPSNGDPVYRLYSPVTAEHLYTKDKNEVSALEGSGWSVDNNRAPLFYSGGKVPVYRLYHEGILMHHLTTDENEYNSLAGQGWKQEGISLYATSVGSSSSSNNSSSSSTGKKGTLDDYRQAIEDRNALGADSYFKGAPGYSLIDLDNNGVNELVIVVKDQPSYVYGIITLKDNGEYVVLAQSGYEDYGYQLFGIDKDNNILYNQGDKVTVWKMVNGKFDIDNQKVLGPDAFKPVNLPLVS